ncbi:MAG: MamI family restriction endonuclease [Actinomycetota bacterium]|nr:MamI family restriction endonuclease [Actinomycetota bacterium]
MTSAPEERLAEALRLLDHHREAFHAVVDVASETGHPVPMDTRGWSQIIVSVLTGVHGLDRKKGADLDDGSDVKGANTWHAIDTPRFNGVVKAGTQADASDSIASLDAMPYLYFVLWDTSPRGRDRCRIWVVRPDTDPVFRAMADDWYEQRAIGTIKSNNFQLHPPRGKDSDEIRNSCGNLLYPLFFAAEVGSSDEYEITTYDPAVLVSGICRPSR